MKRTFICIAWLLCTFIAHSQSTAQSTALQNFLLSESLKHAAVSVEIMDLSSGKIMAAHNQNMALTPASTMKLVTTATAWNVLGEKFTYFTPLSYSGTIANDTLLGNLYVEGAGDPTLGSKHTEIPQEDYLETWLAGIKKAGIQYINGDIIVLDELFGYDGFNKKWLLEDQGEEYAPGIYGISIYDNWRTDTIQGEIANLGQFLADRLLYYFQENQIEISGTATTYSHYPVIPEFRPTLASVTSPDLGSIIRITLVKSNNHYAEHIYKLLTLNHNVDISAYWKEQGLDTSALWQYDGSGLATQNALSAHFLVHLLQKMDKSGFETTMPVAGEEGTVKSFLKNTVLKGKARIKSGSMTDVQSYAGYIDHNGKRYAFAIIVNHFSGSRATLRHEMEKLLTAGL
jgi:D-alanyl-D-alanine carboxypeptidase/D-alanyl-D-alanine-endopeptidase (penicillin-binding protein 4)